MRTLQPDRTLGAFFTFGTGGARFAFNALRPGRALFAFRADRTLETFFACLPRSARFAFNALQALFAFRTRGAARALFAFGAGCTRLALWSRRAGRADGALRAVLTGRPCRPTWAGRSCGSARPPESMLPLRVRRAGTTSWAHGGAIRTVREQQPFAATSVRGGRETLAGQQRARAREDHECDREQTACPRLPHSERF